MKKLIFLLLPLVLTTACSKAILKDNRIGYPAPSEVEALYKEHTHASFSFKSFYDPLCGSAQSLFPCFDYYGMSGFVRDQTNGGIGLDGGVLSVGGVSISPRADENGGLWYKYTDQNTIQHNLLANPSTRNTSGDIDLSFMSKIFGGKEVPVLLTKDGKQIFQSTFIVPEEIHWKAPIPADFYFTRELDFNLEWNKDESNTLGVLIRISSNGKVVMWHSNDDGIENLKEAFAEFPADADEFDIKMVRGNIAVLDGTDGRRYKIYFETFSEMRVKDR